MKRIRTVVQADTAESSKYESMLTALLHFFVHDPAEAHGLGKVLKDVNLMEDGMKIRRDIVITHPDYTVTVDCGEM